MKYYKDPYGNVFAYESDGSQDGIIPVDQILITEQEALQLATLPPQFPNMPEPPAEELIATAHARINTAYESAVGSITAGYPDREIASWPKQESEARAWTANNSALTPWMDAAATARGITKADLAAKIIANADLFTSASGQLSGKRQKLRDQIDALGASPTEAQLAAIQW